MTAEAGSRSRRVLITGVTGQDGYYLSKSLSQRGHTTYGLTRRPLETELDYPHVKMLRGDLTDADSLQRALIESDPHEVYNLAALSSVSDSFANPSDALRTNTLGFLNLLETVRALGKSDVKIFQASSSEMFGDAFCGRQDENTPLRPSSPYGASKAAAHQLASVYRNAHGMFVACGILFNHESIRRPSKFVTRKIANGVARIHLGKQSFLTLGNLEVERDWGWAPEYVEAMQLIIDRPDPDDFVIATGEVHSLADFVASAFRVVGIEHWEDRVRSSARLFRPSDVRRTVGDPSKARRILGWRACTTFDELVELLVLHELHIEQSEPVQSERSSGSIREPLDDS